MAKRRQLPPDRVLTTHLCFMRLLSVLMLLQRLHAHTTQRTLPSQRGGGGGSSAATAAAASSQLSEALHCRREGIGALGQTYLLFAAIRRRRILSIPASCNTPAVAAARPKHTNQRHRCRSGGAFLSSMALLLLVAGAVAVAAAAAGGATPTAGGASQLQPRQNVTCQPTSNAVLLTFQSVADTDLYFLEMYATPPNIGDSAAAASFASATAATTPNRSVAPFAIQTTAAPLAYVHDLLPDRDYYFVVRSHVASAPSIVWTWRNATAADVVHCRTRAARPASVAGVVRARGSLAEATAAELEWTAPRVVGRVELAGRAGDSAASRNFRVRLIRVGAHDIPLRGQGVAFADTGDNDDSGAAVSVNASAFPTEQRVVVARAVAAAQAPAGSPTSATQSYQARLEGLTPGSTYMVTIEGVAVADGGGGNAQRQSAGRGDASSAAVVAGVSDAVVVRTLPAGQQASNFTAVLRVSEYTTDFDFLQNHDGASFEASSSFLTNTNDNDFFNLNVSSPPVTRYCVEHLLPPKVAELRRQRRAQQGEEQVPLPSDPFADYVSCNGPEGEPRNRKQDPVCICEAYADRMIALQTEAEMDAACGAAPVDPATGTHGAPDCLCNGSKWNVPAHSARYIGAATVWEPYFYYQLPRPSYPGSRVGGLWYSMPRDGACGETQSIGDGGCTWKRHPVADAVYGAQLMALGWNNTAIQHWPLHVLGVNTTAQTEHNLAIFKQAWAALDEVRTSRCCGC